MGPVDTGASPKARSYQAVVNKAEKPCAEEKPSSECNPGLPEGERSSTAVPVRLVAPQLFASELKGVQVDSQACNSSGHNLCSDSMMQLIFPHWKSTWHSQVTGHGARRQGMRV